MMIKRGARHGAGGAASWSRLAAKKPVRLALALAAALLLWRAAESQWRHTTTHGARGASAPEEEVQLLPLATKSQLQLQVSAQDDQEMVHARDDRLATIQRLKALRAAQQRNSSSSSTASKGSAQQGVPRSKNEVKSFLASRAAALGRSLKEQRGDAGQHPTKSGRWQKDRKKHHVSERVKRLVTEALEEEGADAFVSDAVCQMQYHTNYHSEKIAKWGYLNLQNSSVDCCASCMAEPECNVWVWCGARLGCGADRVYRECWLKQASLKVIKESMTKVNQDIPWISGTTVHPERFREEDDLQRLQRLRDNPDVPLVYLDVNIRGHAAGRIVLALQYSVSPLAASTFRWLCLGQGGSPVPASSPQDGGSTCALKDAVVGRIVHRSRAEWAADLDANTTRLLLEEDGGGGGATGPAAKQGKAGLLSVLLPSPGTSQARFSLTLGPVQPALGGQHVVVPLGEVVEGMNAVRAISEVARGKKEETAGPEEEVVIADCGEIRAPSKVAQMRLEAATSQGASFAGAGGSARGRDRTSRTSAGSGMASSIGSGEGGEGRIDSELDTWGGAEGGAAGTHAQNDDDASGTSYSSASRLRRSLA